MQKLDIQEWGNYLQAFDAYIKARRHGDEEKAQRARMVMGYFASQKVPEEMGARPQPCSKVEEDLFPLLDQLDLL